jgi:prepilin-type N-terminal cleavage/methylation domain-containing protein
MQRRNAHSFRSARGFTLVEALVAVALVAAAIGAVAQLAALAAAATRAARSGTMATFLAQDKMEELRALAPQLQPSPADALERNVAAYSDFRDTRGEPTDEPDAAAYVRRWSIAADTSRPEATLLQVVVYAAGQSTPTVLSTTIAPITR